MWYSSQPLPTKPEDDSNDDEGDDGDDDNDNVFHWDEVEQSGLPYRDHFVNTQW